MSLIHEIDYGTPKSKAEKTVTLTIDGMTVSVPEGTSVMRAAMGITPPSEPVGKKRVSSSISEWHPASNARPRISQ